MSDEKVELDFGSHTDPAKGIATGVRGYVTVKLPIHVEYESGDWESVTPGSYYAQFGQGEVVDFELPGDVEQLVAYEAAHGDLQNDYDANDAVRNKFGWIDPNDTEPIVEAKS